MRKLQTGLSLSGKSEGGKSGQRRATHRLIAGPGIGVNQFREESATENNRPDPLVRDKGENVR